MMSNGESKFFRNNRGKILMAIVFAVIGILFMSLGWKAFFVLFLAAVGFFVGYLLDDRELLRRFLNNYLGK